MLSAGSVDSLSLAGLAGAVGLTAWLLLRSRPLTALVLWCVAIAFVPVWFGATIVVYLMPATLIGGIVVASAVWRARWTPTWTDVGVLGFFVVCIAPLFVGLGNIGTVATVATQWVVAFAVGRLLAERLSPEVVYLVIAVVMAIAGVLAVVEFVLSWNPFVELGRPNALYTRWGTLQERGGIVRAEGAFGHSIALGACLALAVPMALSARVRATWRLALVAALVAGAVVSFSRIGMLCSVGGIVLSLLFLPQQMGRRLRVVVCAGLVGALVVVLPFVTSIFAAAGDEAAGSASYRGYLVDLLPSISVLGLSPDAQVTASGEMYFGRFRSIDNALLYLGLTYGWLAIGVLAVLLALAGVAVLRRRASPATVAVVAQVPALVTVSLITQYGMFLWFVAGIAVAHEARLRLTAPPGRSPGRSPGTPDFRSAPEQSAESATGRSSVG